LSKPGRDKISCKEGAGTQERVKKGVYHPGVVRIDFPERWEYFYLLSIASTLRE